MSEKLRSGVVYGALGVGAVAVRSLLKKNAVLTSELQATREQVLMARADSFKAKSELEHAREEARTDPLTKLPNRSVLEEAFNGLMESRSSNRTGDPQKNTHSLVAIDLDEFKQANDSGGHNFGDQVLISSASAIEASIRHRDVPVRQGGDEFVVLLPRANGEEAAEVAERIRLAIQAGNETGITASIGVAEINPSLSLSQNLELADAAAYQAKELGRNQVVSYSQTS